MARLAAFDFDQTIVSQDSDATIIRRLQEKKPPPVWNNKKNEWTPYMSNVFEHAYSAGLSPEFILESIASMPPNPGMPELLKHLAESNWDVIFITDANSIFVNHWLKMHGLDSYINEVITNKAFWDNGRLFIEPCMNQSTCDSCPTNLCKSITLSRWMSKKIYEMVVYVGDGRNDFCPATILDKTGIIFPREGFPLDRLVKMDQESQSPKIQAKVVTWKDGFRILKELV